MADVSNVVVNVDNTKVFKKELSGAIRQAMEEIGQSCEAYAKYSCPVDTGRLRNSITHELENNYTVAVGTNVEYGKYVELGTEKQKAQPFLKPAAVNNVNVYRGILKSALSK